MGKKLQLEKLNKKIGRCRKCFLWKTRKNTVPGEGKTGAKIMVLGQAPGAEEDKTGRPFVGRAGQLLTQLLNKAGLDRKDVFITSPVKCFPPKNRKPSKEEIKFCLPYLEKQIKIISPRRFILLGEIAFGIFFPGEKLKDYRGKVIIKNGREYFIVYHPAAGIRFQKFRRILEKDFKNISRYF